MPHLPLRLAAFTLLFCAAALPALAESSAASSASDSASTSVGSLSDSIKGSSNSSSNDKVAQGDYRLVDVAAAPERPGFARLTLQALQPGNAAPARFELWVPQQVLESHPLTAGETIAARQRPYGLEFANGQPRQAFFLVLADDWYRELQTRPVVL